MPDFVHGVFSKTDHVVVALKTWLASKRIDLGRFAWFTPEKAPDFTEDPEVAVVCDLSFGTLKETFESAWEWAVSGQRTGWRARVTPSDEEMLTTLDGIPFRPWTMGWRRIKLDAHVNKRPRDVRSARTSPGCAMLFMAAQHPVRIRKTDYRTRFGLWLPGLKCTAPLERPLHSVPLIAYDGKGQAIELGTNFHGESDACLAVPVYLE